MYRRFIPSLRWDTGCYTLDLADLSETEAGETISWMISKPKSPAFLAGEGTISRLEKIQLQRKPVASGYLSEISQNLNLKELYFSILL